MDTPQKITTRLATPEDYGVLEKLEKILHSRAEPDYIDCLFQTVKAGERSVILAFMNGHPGGYAVVNWKPGYNLFVQLKAPELQDLNVLPDMRRHGLGYAIVAACEDLARGRDCPAIGLAVGLDRGYGSAQRLYVRMGYQPDGFGVTYDRNPVMAGEVRPIDDNLCLMMIKEFS